MNRPGLVRVAVTGAVLGILILSGAGTGAAGNDAPFATVTLWEIQEFLRFKPAGQADDPEAVAMRLARATLVGDGNAGLCAPAGQDPCAMDATAMSRVDLRTGTGPISGRFNILRDTNPASPLLSDLELVATGFLHGTLDLTPVLTGAGPFAPVTGTWGSPDLKAFGRFVGVFLVPVPAEQLGAVCPMVFAYVSPDTGLECLELPDFSLGAPVTKFVGTLTRTKPRR